MNIKNCFHMIFLSFLLIASDCGPKSDTSPRSIYYSICVDENWENLPSLEQADRENKFKVLVLPFAFRKHVAGFINDFIKALESEGWDIVDAETQVISHDPVADIQKATGKNGVPDIVAFYILRGRTLDMWNTLADQEFAKVLIVEDIHFLDDLISARRFAEFGSAFFVRYPEAFSNAIYPKVPAHVFSLYHAASAKFFAIEDNQSRISKALLSGAVHPSYYPLRVAAVKLIEGNFGLIEHYVHPGYGIVDPVKTQEAYIETIKKYKIAIAGMVYGPELYAPYVIAKHFEIPATGTPMITDELLEPFLQKIGFIKNVNYIAASSENLKQTIEYWLKPENEAQLKQIGQKGYDLVKAKHTLDARVKMFDETCLKVHKLKASKY